MKKKKLLLAGLGLMVLTVGLSSCTTSFCSIEDKSSIMYAYDIYHVVDKDGKEISDQYSYGITTYYDATNAPEGALDVPGYDNLKRVYDVKYNLAIVDTKSGLNTNAKQQKIKVNDDLFVEYFAAMDQKFLDYAVDYVDKNVDENIKLKYVLNSDGTTKAFDKKTMNAKDIQRILMGTPSNKNGTEDNPTLRGYGYTKYVPLEEPEAGQNPNYWSTFDKFNNEVRNSLGVDFCPSTDYLNLYKLTMERFAQQVNSCIAVEDNFYGYYGFNNKNKTEVFITAKDFDYAWSKGWLEGLLVYPISWLIDSTTVAFMGIGAGLAQVFAVLVITFLIRAIMMLFTINQTTMNAKMSEIQPEMAKIQAKYPNANTNKNEQQQMAMEMQSLYKKNKIHPFRSILVMIVQFPVFICVWGAMQGSAMLSSDAFLGLKLSESVMQTLTNTEYLPGNETGWWTAFVLFIIFAILQTFSMLLPQMIQKRKQKKALVHTGKNPAQKQQQNTMKVVTIVMLVMIILMGLSLASGMVVYWIAGSIWSIAQTYIIEWIQYLKNKNKHTPNNKKPKRKKQTLVTSEGPVEDAVVLPSYMQAPTGKKKYKDKE